MRILISNDDGINAPGIKALVERFKDMGEIIVVAPAKHQSGAGHSLTIDGLLKVKPLEYMEGIKGFAVYGTPRDCTELAINALIDEPIDLIVSGVNMGSNIANNMAASGTCGAACAGVDFHIPAIATSLDFGDSYDYTDAADFTYKVANWFIKQPFKYDFVLNINVPNRPKEEIKGYQVCRNGGLYVFHQDLTPTFDGEFYYYNTKTHKLSYRNKLEDMSGDIYALENGYITIQPIDMDLIKYPCIDQLKNALEETF